MVCVMRYPRCDFGRHTDLPNAMRYGQYLNSRDWPRMIALSFPDGGRSARRPVMPSRRYGNGQRRTNPPYVFYARWM